MSFTEITGEGLAVEGAGSLLVEDCDFSAAAGRVQGITGPSSSGKTSLLFVIGGLVPAARGQLLVDGRTLSLWRDASVGLIFQNLCLVPFLSAQETVALPLQAKGTPSGEVAERSAAALCEVGLGEHMAQLVGDLSGGQRQRVAVARALAGRPDVILADEPTASLDSHWRGVVLDLLRAAARRGAIVVISSSDEDVISACDAVTTIRQK
jgi:ABC-type lipoprotein export system ATPase subunit